MCGTEYLRWMYGCNKRNNNTGWLGILWRWSWLLVICYSLIIKPLIEKNWCLQPLIVVILGPRLINFKPSMPSVHVYHYCFF